MAAANPTDEDRPQIIELGPGFYVRQEVDNLTWFDLGGYAIIVDALEQKSLEDEVLELLDRTLASTPVKYLLNTHLHYDHVALNDAFAHHYGCQIVNQQSTPLGPQGRWFQGDRRRAWMLPMGGCHTEDDCIVWVEPDRVLLVGDIFGWGLIPLIQNLRSDTLAHLETCYQRLIEFDATAVVPGHGPLCQTQTLRRWLDYLHWLIEEAKAGCQRGLSDSQIIEQLPPPPDMRDWWRFLKWKHADTVAKVVKSARRGWLD